MQTPLDLVFVGTAKHVVALDALTGQEFWRTKLPDAGGIVALIVRDDAVFAASQGHVYRLDRVAGSIVWRNELKGLGFQHVLLAADPLWLDDPGAAAVAAAAAAQATSTARSSG